MKKKARYLRNEWQYYTRSISQQRCLKHVSGGAVAMPNGAGTSYYSCSQGEHLGSTRQVLPYLRTYVPYTHVYNRYQ